MTGRAKGVTPADHRRRAARPGSGAGRSAAVIVVALGLAGAALAATGTGAPDSGDATVAPLPAPGSRFHTVIEVAHKRIPLPPGTWQVAGRGDESLANSHLGAYGVMESLVLVRLAGRTVESFMVIHANAVPVDRGWGTNSECAGAALPLTRLYDTAGANLFCGFGGPVGLRRDGVRPDFWQETLTQARHQNWTMPEHWLMGGFRISDRHDVVEVRYHYQPPPAPLAAQPPANPPGVIAASWPGTAGAATRAEPGPPWLPALAGWSESMKAPIEHGFKGRLGADADVPALPGERAAAAEAGHPPAGPAGPADQAPDSLAALFHHSVLKMLSWKVLGISSGLAIKYLFIGDITTALSLQVATSVVTGVLYVGYDMAWATLFPDTVKPVVNFATVTGPS